MKVKETILVSIDDALQDSFVQKRFISGCLNGLIYVVTRSLNDKMSLERRKISPRGCYDYKDPRTGMTWILNRKLSNEDMLELERRKVDGEPTGVILKDLGALYLPEEKEKKEE